MIKQIEAKDVDNIEKQFAALKKQSNVTGERMRYELARGHYAGLIANHKLQRNSYSRALHEGERLLKDDYQVSLLKQIHYLDLELNDLTSATTTAQKIIELSKDEGVKDTYREQLQIIDDFIKSDKDIVIDADLEQNESWHYALSRNEFSIANIEGELHKLEVRCANKRHVFTIAEDNLWHVPQSWQGCSVYIMGDDYSKFKFIEVGKKQVVDTVSGSL
ncbi:hypothetical protein [Thalassotalea sp. ND16A]|uniref:hypothetical protein n=1 Tax=Thalassotalea sp. ND16A TaxID=1535422 RepID=UPI00051DE939|nr:hypothetical protein [Thalassotalea sp. ND16A]KGJ98065.1 hypothetical protein ND16A_0870 [Thalassotalea sp. ND16A]